ncbi:hypothetical protein DUI87_00620 [Hirundo rustica rustica]|uniref:Uncharacterized protein n=1 Tax=Hirundo rustica rustica TaxID=333673 RepID=A0A3M0LA85_HIRRU|nr:hypothetical protein DUI87_00620 [Hirundo rustica rustica]
MQSLALLCHLQLMLETVSSCSDCCCLKKETNFQLTTATLQEVVESDKVTSESPFLQAKQPQFPQLFFIRFVLQAPHQPRCPPLDTLKHLKVLPKLRGPEQDTILKVRDIQSTQDEFQQGMQHQYCGKIPGYGNVVVLGSGSLIKTRSWLLTLKSRVAVSVSTPGGHRPPAGSDLHSDQDVPSSDGHTGYLHLLARLLSSSWTK